MSIKRRIDKLERQCNPETDVEGLNDLADMLYGKEDRPQINKPDSVWTNLKRIVPGKI